MYPPSRAPAPGWFAVSVNLVYGRPSWSVDVEGHAIYVEQGQYTYFSFSGQYTQ